MMETGLEVQTASGTQTVDSEPVSSTSRRGSRSSDKDLWDKFQAVSTFLSGVIIALVGLVFTNNYNERQAIRDQMLKEQELRVAQVDLIQKFMPQLTGSDRDQHLALVAISALGNSDLATTFATLHRSEGARRALRSIAANGRTESERSLAAKALADFELSEPTAVKASAPSR